MAIYDESGLRFNLPDGLHFRLADLPAYKAVNGLSVKEMDFAWLDGGRLVVLEVRNYAQVTATLTGADLLPGQGQAPPFRFQALIDKVTDTTLMLLAAWAGTKWGLQLRADLPTPARTPLPLKLIVAVDLPQALTVHLLGLRDSLNARLRGRVVLADVDRVVLMDYARLVAHPALAGRVSTLP